MNDKVKRIIRNLIIGFIVTVAAVISFYWYYGSEYALYIGLICTVGTIILSKVYLLPFASVKIEGTVTKSRVKSFYERRLRGSTPGRATGSLRTSSGFQYTDKLKVVVSIKTIQGGWFRKAFDFESEEDDLPVGTKIRFTIFDDKPQIIKIVK